MKVDLHIHTKYSDGEYNEEEIIEKVYESGIREFAICDHDTINGSKKVFELLQKGNPHNLIFHSGVELSCRIKDFKGGINTHILYRDFEYDNKVLLNFLEEMKIKRLNKIDLMLDIVKKEYNIIIPKERVLKLLENTNSIGKPHIYMLLCEYGNYDKEKFYKNMDKMQSQNLKLDIYELFNSLKNEKGYLTLAHPIEIIDEYNLSFDDIDELVKQLKELGLKGIETKHSKINKEQYAIFHNIAEKYGLIETCGSDYHGPKVKPNVKLGHCSLD